MDSSPGTFSLASYREARSLGALLAARGHPVRTAPRPDGRAVVTVEGDALFASLCCLGDGRVEGYVRTGLDEWDGTAAFDGRTVPPEILGLDDLPAIGCA